MYDTKSTTAWVSGSLAGPEPAYSGSPGDPIGPHRYGKLRLRSTRAAFQRCGTAWPSGFIDSINQRSTPGGTGIVASRWTIAAPSSSSPWITPMTRTTVPPGVPRSTAMIGRPWTDRPISSACTASVARPATPATLVVVVVLELVLVGDDVAAAGSSVGVAVLGRGSTGALDGLDPSLPWAVGTDASPDRLHEAAASASVPARTMRVRRANGGTIPGSSIELLRSVSVRS